jgi:hypothetical protein
MRIAIVTINARVVGGVESYLDTVIPLLEAAGHEIALLCEYDAPHTSRPIARSSDVPVWSMAEIGTVRSLDSLRRWRPDVIYTHGLSNLEFEARALTVAPAMAYVHDYRATCISGAQDVRISRDYAVRTPLRRGMRGELLSAAMRRSQSTDDARRFPPRREAARTVTKPSRCTDRLRICSSGVRAQWSHA